MLHLVMEEAIERKRRIGLLFIDWEAQYQLTIRHVEEQFRLYENHVDPFWVALPMTTTNACSQFEPEWICWEHGKQERWVRDPHKMSITDESRFPFYYYGMTFEEFVPAFGHWYGREAPAACFVGIRTRESLNRWRSIAAGKKRSLDGRCFTTWAGKSTWNIYPIYDWTAEDDWTYFARSGKPYNQLYDRMHQAGISIHQMRICEPYGDEQRKGLWLFQVVEPETWGRIVARVAGANTGAIYANECGNVMGNIRISKPDGRTWKQFAEFLLSSMPHKTADHYRDKIAVWLHWYEVNQDLTEIPDEVPGDTGSKDMASWRRVCKVLLKNDYWCKGLCFSPTKASSYERYKKIMRKRRDAWGVF